MPSLKVLHDCSHTIITTHEQERYKIITASGSDIDRIMSEHPVKKLLGVVQSGIDYTINVDVIKVGRDAIRWLSFNRPDQGENVTVFFVEQTSTTTAYSLQECPRCNGRGWYVSVKNENEEMEKVSGLESLTQEYIKLLLTYMGENRLDLTYGSELLMLPSENLIRSEDVVDRVRIILKESELKLREIQTSKLRLIPEDEQLKKIEIKDVVYNQTLRRVFITLKIISQTMDELETTFGV